MNLDESLSACIKRAPLYAITGKKGSGKDTFAKLVKEFGNAHITHFATKLKATAGAIFGLSHDQLWDEEAKEAPLEKPIFMDDYLPQMREATGLDLKPLGLVAYSPRNVMQYYGTEYVRHTQDDYWIENTRAEIRYYTDFGTAVFIPDLRFTNEETATKLEDGLIIKTLRVDAEEAKDTHTSEQQMESIIPDLLVGARTGDLSLPRIIAMHIAQQDFTKATMYDYRLVQKILISAAEKKTAKELVESFYSEDISEGYVVLSNILNYYGTW